mmetsp:Transcript_35521/g.46881  ORF Transcript_35521/g.46881 Transcript_35521/m.46881 type:complete len:230 (+) Transcript_35521:95-784(+)
MLRNCSSHEDCSSNALYCFQGYCDCIPAYGYGGEECTQASFSTTMYAIVNCLIAFGACIFLHFNLRGMIGYTFHEIISFLNARTEEIERIRRPIQLSFKSKDRCLFSNFFFGLGHFMLTISGAIGGFQNSYFKYQWPIMESIFVPFTFFFWTLTQLEVGLAWLEVYSINALQQQVGTRYKVFKNFIHVFVLFEACSIVVLLQNQDLRPIAPTISGLFGIISPLIWLPSG